MQKRLQQKISKYTKRLEYKNGETSGVTWIELITELIFKLLIRNISVCRNRLGLFPSHFNLITRKENQVHLRCKFSWITSPLWIRVALHIKPTESRFEKTSTLIFYYLFFCCCFLFFLKHPIIYRNFYIEYRNMIYHKIYNTYFARHSYINSLG